jgi:Subtilase family
LATEHPIVRLKRVKAGERIKAKQKPWHPSKIPYSRQAQRLGGFFVKAEQSLATYAADVTVAEDPRAVVPERCLVFELVDDVPMFNLAAQALGLEWLATEEVVSDGMLEQNECESEDGEDKKRLTEDLPAKRLYLTMPTERALQQLLTRWKRYEKGAEPRDKGEGELWKLFGYLHNLHVWSIEDRLDPSMVRYVETMIEDKMQKGVLVELDLWYRDEGERRDESMETLQAMLAEVGGELLDSVDIEEIRYQGALIRVPGDVARQLAEGRGTLAKNDDVMTIRPQSSYESQIEPGEAGSNATLPAPSFDRDCIAVLLDGYPIDQHVLLADRLKLFELEVKSTNSPAASRLHGTAMASLIVHGDLQSPATTPLNRPLAVLPVLVAPDPARRETTPVGKLPIGVIYRAITQIVLARKHPGHVLSKVVVINHSICDDFAPFVRRQSPWATLLDYFSHEHKLLFVVSAGNIFSSFPLSEYKDLAAYNAATEDDREAAMLIAVEMAKGTRSILSPAEGINVLTVGAAHADDAPLSHAAPPDPYPSYAMSNLASGSGLGVNRSVKPDVLEKGGRFIAGVANGKNGIDVHPKASSHYGQEVAAPSKTGQLDRRIRTAGTSNAAALVTRSAHFVADALDEVFEADKLDWYKLDTRAVMVRTLLAHGASWGKIGEVLGKAYPPRKSTLHATRKNTITRFLGYGQLDVSRVISGGSNRITLLAEDKIHAEQRHEYALPVPPSLLNTKDLRRCTITLSWSCPTIHTTSDHRAVTLRLAGAANTSKFWEGVKRNSQPNAATAHRGTLVHMVLEGNNLVEDEEGRIVIGVQAMAKAGFEKLDVPYALAITLEVGQRQRSQLYAEVEEQVRGKARSRVNN